MSKEKCYEFLLCDCGGSATRWVIVDDGVPSEIHSLPSVVEDSEADAPMDENIVIIGGRGVRVGKTAFSLRSVEKLSPVLDGHIGSDEYVSLIFGVLLRAGAAQVGRLLLAVPDGLIKSTRSILTQRLTGLIDLGFDRTCRVDEVFIVGQGRAGTIGIKQSTIRGKILSIDAGHKTIIVTLRDGGESVSTRSRTLDIGGSKLLLEIAKLFTQSDSAQDLLASEIFTGLSLGRRIFFKGQQIELTQDLVNRTTWARDSINRIFEVIRTVDDIPRIYLAGGSGNYLSAGLESRAPGSSVYQQEEPRFAVMRGLVRLAKLRGRK